MRDASDGSPGLRTTPSGWTRPLMVALRPEPRPAGCPGPPLLLGGRLSTTTLPLWLSPPPPRAGCFSRLAASDLPLRRLPGRPRPSRTPVGIRKSSRVPGCVTETGGFLRGEQPGLAWGHLWSPPHGAGRAHRALEQAAWEGPAAPRLRGPRGTRCPEPGLTRPASPPPPTPARTSAFDLHRRFQDLVYQAGTPAKCGFSFSRKRSRPGTRGVRPPHGDGPATLHRDHSPWPGPSAPACRGPRPARSALLTCRGPAALGWASSGPTNPLCDPGPASAPLCVLLSDPMGRAPRPGAPTAPRGSRRGRQGEDSSV